MLCGGIFVLYVVIYGKMRLIFDHLFIHIRTNLFEERAVFFYLIDTGVRSQ